MWFSLVTLGVITLLLHSIYKRLSNSNRKYWQKYGVGQVDASSVASNWEIFMGKKDASLRDAFAYQLLTQTREKCCGLIENSYKVLLLKDVELIKKILIKDFEYFPNRRDFFAAAKDDSILKKMMGSLTGEAWKDLRHTLTPTFSTGKIRKMNATFNNVGRDWAEALTTRAKGNSTGSLKIDAAKDISQYTVDVIAAAVFGMNAGTVQNPESEFSKMAFRFANFSIYKMMLGMQFPWLAKMLGLEFIDTQAMSWFEQILNSGLQQRLKGGPKHNDFLQLLADAKMGELKAVTEDELNDFEKDAMGHIKTGKKVLLSNEVLNAQSLLFFLAGFSTTTNFIAFCLYALAAYPEVQKKLREEVDRIAKKDGDFDYDELSHLPYMEMFVCEVMRINPAQARLERICEKTYKDKETGMVIPKGTIVAIPVMSMHTDPQYFEEPDKFDPELHFSPEKKAGRSPYVYLPFGSGPRNCIGMRFALIEGKAAVAHIVHRFLIDPTDKTPMPMKGVQASLQVLPPPDLELKLTPRGK